MKKQQNNENLINYLAKEAVDKLHCDISGICSYSAELITERLLKENLSNFYVIEGYVKVPGWTGRTSHSWIQLDDDTIIDPVFDQFPSGTERLLSFQKKYKPREYMKLVESHVIDKGTVGKYVAKLREDLKEFFIEMSEADKPPVKKSDDKKDSEKEIPSDDKASASPETEIPKDEPFGAAAGGTDNIFTGQDAPAGIPKPDGDGTSSGEPDEKSNISNYSEKLKSSKIIKYQKTEPEPGYKFEPDDKFYSENYVGKTKSGSILLAVPSFDSDNKEKSLNFIKKFVLPKIQLVVKNALSQRKRIVLMGHNGIPYVNGKYAPNEQGMIAKYLNDKYKGGYVIFDTWSPQEYYAFVSNDELWHQVKERTQSENLEIKSALYLYLLTTIHGRKFTNKLKTPNVLKMIESWGLNQDDVEKFTSNGLSKIASIVYPELTNNPETLVSFIIKTYLQLLRVNMMQKLLKYEKTGKIVISLADEHTAWALKPSFDKADEFLNKEKPHVTPGADNKKRPVPPKKDVSQPEKKL